MDDGLVDAIDALLPQTQCTRCGFEGCRPYAHALAHGEADINQCPPGGQVTIEALAHLLQREPKPLNPANGVEQAPRQAVIDESLCIGCAKCLPACPVDAIVGAQRFMHTVIAQDCNGCELCLPPCPVDCIRMVPVIEGNQPRPIASWSQLRQDADRHRARYEAHRARRERDRIEREQLLAARKQRAASWSKPQPPP